MFYSRYLHLVARALWDGIVIRSSLTSQLMVVSDNAVGTFI